MDSSIQQLRKNRSSSNPLMMGKISTLQNISDPSAFLLIIGYSIIGAIIGGAISFYQIRNIDYAIDVAKITGLLTALAYAVWPIIAWVTVLFLKKQLPEKNHLPSFSKGHTILSALSASLILLCGVNQTYDYLSNYFNQTIKQTTSLHHKHHRKFSLKEELLILKLSSHHTENELPSLSHNQLLFIFNWLALALALYKLTQYLLEWKMQQQATIKKSGTLPFRLWLGHSTGKLSQLSHGAGLAPQQQVTISLEDAAQNVLILGGIGSGKTTRAVYPLLIQLLDQHCGGLIFDIKNDFHHAALAFAKKTNHLMIMIGPGHQKMNLLAGLAPEIASSFLKSTFLLNGKNSSDGFWMDTATELCRNTLGILSFLPEHYHLQGLYSYLFNINYRSEIDGAIDTLLSTLDERQARLLTSYCHYHQHIFDHFDQKIKAGVHATIAQVLSPFNHPDLIDTFCSSGEENALMEEVLNGTVYLVNLPLSVWGLGGKVVYSLIKLRFYNVMQQRTTRTDWNQTNPVFFICDEFQEIVSANKDGLSDLNFWDKSRSSKTIGIISTQAISSFYATIGDRDISHALLQNFRQKICFRTEDNATLNYFNELTDKVEVIRETYGKTTSKQSHPERFLSSRSTSSIENRSLVDKPVLSAQLFRKLQENYAVMLLSIGGKSMDDVVCMMPVYVD